MEDVFIVIFHKLSPMPRSMVTYVYSHLLQRREVAPVVRLFSVAVLICSLTSGDALRPHHVPLCTPGTPIVDTQCASPLRSSSTLRAITTPAGDFERSHESTYEEGSVPESRTWHWRNGFEIHYEHARCDGAPPLVFLPGFGVGTFHFKRNMQELSKAHDVYSLDFLGQGKSWPTRAPSRQDGLCYGVDMWTEQVHAFIEQIVGEPAYVAGNSLGGFIGANLAAKHPRAVLGLALLNATPFWAFRQTQPTVDAAKHRHGWHRSNASASRPRPQPQQQQQPLAGVGVSESESDGSSDWLRWDGTLPAPKGLFRFGAWYFDRMRDPRTVKSMLSAVYSNPEAIGDDVVTEIIAATRRGPTNHDYGSGGHEAFTSIVFSPKTSMSFEDMIERVSVPLALVYGKEDPWVVPLWGHRIKRQRPDILYYQVSPSGHTPHHETPKIVNTLLKAWLEHARSGGPPLLSQPGEVLEMKEDTGVAVRASLVPDALPRGPVEWLDDVIWNITREEGDGGGISRRGKNFLSLFQSLLK